jgi:DNA-binding MarR family transcriptional regulator
MVDMTTPTLNPQIVGQAENAHGAIMTKVLAGTGLDRDRWVALSLTMFNGGAIEASQLTERLTGALKIDPATAQHAIADLAAAGLLTADGGLVSVTDPGQVMFDQVRAATGPVLARAYADVPAEDLQTAARVLIAITAGLNRELS